MKKICLMLSLLLLVVMGSSAFLGSSRTEGIRLPVLMYHHFIEQGPSEAYTVVSASSFAQQLQALAAAGYTSVTPHQLVEYVDNGAPLPEKPVLITIDDGYTSNLDIAAPILEQEGMTATIFTIGICAGQTIYPHSGEVLDPPRFSFEAAKPWVDKGVLTIQSHTYDMHQRISYGFSGRDGVLSLPGESDQHYRQSLHNDFSAAAQQLQEGLNCPLEALAFPFGLYSIQAVEELKNLGVRVTLTTDSGMNVLISGDPDCLHLLRRNYVNDDMTGEDLIALIDKLNREA